MTDTFLTANEIRNTYGIPAVVLEDWVKHNLVATDLLKSRGGPAKVTFRKADVERVHYGRP